MTPRRTPRSRAANLCPGSGSVVEWSREKRVMSLGEFVAADLNGPSGPVDGWPVYSSSRALHGGGGSCRYPPRQNSTSAQRSPLQEIAGQRGGNERHVLEVSASCCFVSGTARESEVGQQWFAQVFESSLPTVSRLKCELQLRAKAQSKREPRRTPVPTHRPAQRCV